jgi:hypothetical protein
MYFSSSFGMMSRAKRAPALTPYDVLHQRREFVPHDRLLPDVASAGLHSGHALGETRKPAQHQNRRRNASGYEPFKHRLTAQIGQTKVEDDPVERFGQGTLQTGDAGSLTFHSKALECHQHHEGIRRVDLVVDQENPWP